MVIDEAMRLYPPAWIIARSLIGDDEIGGYHLPAGSFAFMSPYATHRHPAFWDNPEGFDPERFSGDDGEQRPRFAYYPFGGGPRQCIGNNFAQMEAALVLAVLWQRWRLDLAPGHPVELDPTITLRPRHGMRMTVHAP
jgi:cytochrome P450